MTQQADDTLCGSATLNEPAAVDAPWQIALRFETTKAQADPTANIFAAIAAGDQKAFKILYSANSNLVYVVALRILRDKSLAEDAVQETFVKIWRCAAQFDGALGSARSWIAMIARNVALDLVRKRRPGKTVSCDYTVTTSTEPCDPPDPKLSKCIASLPAEQVVAILTMYTYGMSHSELSDHLGTPIGTIKSRVRRGTDALKLCMRT